MVRGHCFLDTDFAPKGISVIIAAVKRREYLKYILMRNGKVTQKREE